jgi:hypothetical protein
LFVFRATGELCVGFDVVENIGRESENEAVKQLIDGQDRGNVITDL